MTLTHSFLVLLMLCAALSPGQTSDHHLVIRTLFEEKVSWSEVTADHNVSTLARIEDTLRSRFLEPDWPYPQFDVQMVYAGSQRDVVIFLTTEHDLGHTTRIFSLKNRKPRLIAEYDGYVSAIDRDLSGSIVEFIIVEPPGGDATFYQASLRAFRSGSKGIVIDSITTYSWSMETNVTGVPRREFGREFIVEAQEYNLRTKPIVDKFEFEQEYYSNATSFAVYGSGGRGVVFASKIDGDRREWWLVIMNSRTRRVRIGIKADHLVGWMSAKYLKPVPMPGQEEEPPK
jgi:hypothetical protein